LDKSKEGIMDSPRQLEINKIINERKLKQNWLAGEIGINNRTLSYQLNGAQDMDDEYYFKIKKLFRETGILSNTPDEISALTSLCIGLTGTVEFNLSLFTKEVIRAVDDKKITDNEKMRLSIKMDDLVETTVNKTRELKKLLGLPL